ncbi:MAG: Ig-like domain-containing protein [Solirubrobacterales bacterium]
MSPLEGTRTARIAQLLGLCLVALFFLIAAPRAHAADRVYWSNYDSNSIAWADLNGDGGGGTVNTTGATVDGPMGLTLDPSRGLVYWANWGGDSGTTISYARLDGSGGGDLAITGATVDAPHGLAIDPTAGPYGTLYWPNHVVDKISWAQLDGSGGGVGGDFDIANATVDEPRGTMIDPLTHRVYWSNFSGGTGMSISYANLDGSGDGDVIEIGPLGEGPEGTAIDPLTRKIYWSDFGQRHLIQFANLDGTGVSTLDTTGAATKGVHGVAIDPDRGRIYWANWNGPSISSAALDGSGGQDLNTSGAPISKPNLPAILKTPAATAPPEVSGGAQPGTALDCSAGTWAGDSIEALMYRAPEGSLSYRWTRDGADLPGAGSDSITATEDGTYRCVVTATNAAGSTSISSAPHLVDGTPPLTTIVSGPNGLTSDSSPTFAFSANESGATFECRLGGGAGSPTAFAACSSPLQYAGLADGTYAFEVAATDGAGNVDPTPASRSFTVDTQPPVTTIRGRPNRKVKTSRKVARVKVAFSSDPDASFRCKLDHRRYEPCSSPYAAVVSSKGHRGRRHTIAVRATDRAGNLGTASVARFRVIRTEKRRPGSGGRSRPSP